MGISQSIPYSKSPRTEQFDPATYFKVKPLNPSTFVIQEQDHFQEFPLIYVKRILKPQPLLLLCDTGCGTSHRSGDLNGPLHNLRSFLETYPVPSNDYEPLNPYGRWPYLILCSHSHYDHINGIPQFAPEASPSRGRIKSTIIASSYSPSYLSPDNLPRHSLCLYFGFATPQYDVGIWAEDGVNLSYQGEVLGEPGGRIITIHIPGHTPDSLAWYDEAERWIYVGDTFYERYEGGGADGLGDPMPIEFGSEGNMVNYMVTLTKLYQFVTAQNNIQSYNNDNDEDWEYADADELTENRPSEVLETGYQDATATPKSRVRLGCAHVTSSVDARSIIMAIQAFFSKLLKGDIPMLDKGSNEHGEAMGFWEEREGQGARRFSVLAPSRLVEEARRHYQIQL